MAQTPFLWATETIVQWGKGGSKKHLELSTTGKKSEKLCNVAYRKAASQAKQGTTNKRNQNYHISLETHQAPARCSEGQNSDEAVQGAQSRDKAITESSAACVKR